MKKWVARGWKVTFFGGILGEMAFEESITYVWLLVFGKRSVGEVVVGEWVVVTA